MADQVWYFECVTMTGRWSPCTAPERPETVTVGGHLRQQRNGAMGPRIRNIKRIPEDMRDLTLNDLRGLLSDHSDTSAVEARHG